MRQSGDVGPGFPKGFGSSMELFTEEVGKLQMDLERQKALASRRGEVITELKDEACSQWASGWLAF